MRLTMIPLAAATGVVLLAGSAAAQTGRVQTYSSPPPRVQQRDLPPMTAGQTEEINRLINPFFERLKTGQTREALTPLINEVIAGKNPELFDRVTGLIDLFLETYGAPTGWELADSTCLTASICRVLYVLYTPQLPVYFEFTLYRRPSGWTLSNINVTDIPNAIF